MLILIFEYLAFALSWRFHIRILNIVAVILVYSSLGMMFIYIYILSNSLGMKLQEDNQVKKAPFEQGGLLQF